MKNPLMKRIPKEFMGEIGKYLVIFLFMAGTIGFVSGFLIAGDSMRKAYNDGFTKYNTEDGNFELEAETGTKWLKDLEEKNQITLYKNYYTEREVTKVHNTKKKSTLRIFCNREKVNKVCLMKGKMPVKADDVAIDRMYADNNKISVGDTMEVDGRTLYVTGLVALPDYSALFSNNSDMMFDAVKFGVAIMTKDGFGSFAYKNMHFNYSWKYEKEPKNSAQKKIQYEALMKDINQSAPLKNFIPASSNQAINFAGDDLGSDRSMMITLLCIVIVIMAFVFAITISNTIANEATVIGTLRASGYTKWEMVVHYLSIPVLVALLSSIIGNVLGYTIFKNAIANMYYGSYSLPTYHTDWNAEAFLLTTIVPLIIMVIVNMIIIVDRLSLSPLKLLRRDLKRKQKKKAMKLPKFKFFTRFRLRIIFQNMPGYVTLFLGIVFANLLLLFGMMMVPLLKHYQHEIVNNMVCDYQYILKTPVETKQMDAEKFALSSLKAVFSGFNDEEISVYGLEKNSNYIKLKETTDGIYVSDGFAEKFSLEKGDQFSLKEDYGNKKYNFKIAGIYKYPSTLAVFMNRSDFNRMFGNDTNYFNGYFTNKKIKDIDEAYIVSKITEEDLTKVSRQLDTSMGSTFYLLYGFSLAMYMLLIYLLSKLIIEKNATAISMVKILGYENREISRLYLSSTTIVVVISTLLSLPIVGWMIREIYGIMMRSFAGWMNCYIDPNVYWKMFLMGMVLYLIVAVLEYRKIKKIPMTQALKNVE